MLRLWSTVLRHTSSSRPPLSLFRCYLSSSSAMDLKTVIAKLEELAPSRYAESWDNVGLLVEPRQAGLINRILLTNDLTEQVMDEAENLHGNKVGLILSYHPPIFRPIKRITQKSAKERIVVRAIELGMAVYSPHTALDPVINDWLLSGLGEGEITSLGLGKMGTSLTNKVEVTSGAMDAGSFVSELPKLCEEAITVSPASGSGSAVSFFCGDKALAEVLPKLRSKFPHSDIVVTDNPQRDVHLRGGKRLTLSQPRPLSQLVAMVKEHLKLPHIRLAKPHGKGEDPLVKTVATCAGSGGSVLSGVAADVYLTGEMSHHEVLEACSRGVAVILCEHSNTERGYLQLVYKGRLETVLEGQVEVVVSERDRDPLQVV